MANVNYSGQQFTSAQVQQLWINAGGPASIAPIAAAIAGAESSFWSGAYNPVDPNGGSYGLFQINGIWAPELQALGLTNWQTDPQQNAQAAVYVYSKTQAGSSSSNPLVGFTPWSTFTSKNYLAFLTPGASASSPAVAPTTATAATAGASTFTPTALAPATIAIVVLFVAIVIVLAVLPKKKAES